MLFTKNLIFLWLAIIRIRNQRNLPADLAEVALDELEELLTSIADRIAAGGQKFTVFYLKYAKAEVAAELLEEILGGGTGQATAGGSLLGDIAGGMLGGDGANVLMGGLGDDRLIARGGHDIAGSHDQPRGRYEYTINALL